MDNPLTTSRFAACLQVFGLTLRRQFLSRQTIVLGVLLLFFNSYFAGKVALEPGPAPHVAIYVATTFH